MIFHKLCDIVVEHGYYNDANSARLQLQLVPAVESARSLRNGHIQIKQNANVFTLLGDVFTASDKPLGDPEGPKLKGLFKLSFALVAADPHFQQATSLHSSELAASDSEDGVLEVRGARKVYYFHNQRSVLTAGKAYLSGGAEVSRTDQVLLYPVTFSVAARREVTEVTLLPHIAHGSGDQTDSAYGMRTITDPADPDQVQRWFDVDMRPFGSGYYPFRMTYREEDLPEAVDVPLYLDDQFYGLRPFAVIDLFFLEGIDSAFLPLEKTFYISIPEAKTTWRYHIVSKYNTYEGLDIDPDPDGVTFKTAVTKVLKTGETATMFESDEALSVKQKMERHHKLTGTHVETLGIFPFEEEDADTPPDDDDGEDSETREIRSLPNPKIEESVWEYTSDEEDPAPLKPYSDMYVYV